MPLHTKSKMNPAEMIKTSSEIHLSYKKTTLVQNEIVLALRGEVGLARMIEKELSGTNITRGLARLSAKKSEVIPEFLIWVLRSPKFRTDLIRRVGGSALQEISLSELRKVEALIPPSPNKKRSPKSSPPGIRPSPPPSVCLVTAFSGRKG